MSVPRGSGKGFQSTRSRKSSQKRFALPWWALGLGAAGIVAAAYLVSLALRPSGETASSLSGLPGPLGGPEVAQDVNTLVGKRAPTFTLSDSEGKSYAVTPGQGKPVVLVFHMGLT